MSLRGYIDGVIGDELVGWALDDAAPDNRLRVRGELDGVVLDTVEASEPRRDLVTAGFGDGGYGFRIAFDPALLTPGEHHVAATVGDEALPLASDWIVRDGADRARESVMLAAGVPTGDAAAPPPEPQPASAPPAPPPVPALVAGAAGWIFRIPAGSSGHTQAQLDAYAAAVEALHVLANALGIVARAVAVPPKHVVYAEHLPPLRRHPPAGRPARAVAARLRVSDVASLLDLHDALQDARTHGRVYSRSGQRLTWSGAIHAYRAIAKDLEGSIAGLRPHPLDAFDFGALAPVADALDGADSEPVLMTRPSAAVAGAATGLIVHDGTAGRIAELLRLHFWRCQVVESERVDPEVVRSVKADAVIWVREDRWTGQPA